MPERPIECSQCRKDIAVLYKEVGQEGVVCTVMCVDCPVLAQKFQAAPAGPTTLLQGETHIFCESCRTSLEAVRRGEWLGCPECYEVFGDLILDELNSRHKLPPSQKGEVGRSTPAQRLHVGKAPGRPLPPATISCQVTALNEALNEALKKENYEQAAWIRDQIQALLKKTE